MNVPEIMMNWVKELIMAPNVMVQGDDNALSGQPYLMPYRISDSSIDSLKSTSNRINYVVTVKLIPAIDYITLRN